MVSISLRVVLSNRENGQELKAVLELSAGVGAGAGCIMTALQVVCSFSVNLLGIQLEKEAICAL